MTDGDGNEIQTYTIVCKCCKDKISPDKRHQRVTCSCGEVFIDGTGTRGAKTDLSNIIEATEPKGLVE